ncbi:hypothetical protein C7M84_022275 [Penaeus vannamei]|uniref:RNA-directed DNA polymerase n=1 Tax=Penaeus vannamei TaxID=6689 RepID=A0A423U747_PENVA|nr:hypothetical protein C7M84_022275 [Penaeus vannamei]
MVLEGLSAKNYVEWDGCRHRISFTRGGITGYHVPACHDVADETPEAVESLELSQSPSPVAVSPVHVAGETVVEARSGKFVAATLTRSSLDDTRLAIVETCTDRLTVPRTLVTVQGHRSSVWVVNPHPEATEGSPRYCAGVCFFPGTRGGGDAFPSAEKACPLEQAQEAREEAAEPLDLTRMMAEQMMEHQLQDPACANLLGWLEGRLTVPRERPPVALSSFEMEEGVLYYLQTIPDQEVRQVYVPNHLQPQALRHAHCPPTAIHPWVHRTFQNLQGAWYFPNMHRLAREYMARCHACQQRKGVAGRAPTEGHPLPEAPLVRVSADLMDLQGSATGFRYVLSIVDHHTRFIQLVPLRDKSANRVLWAFVDHYVTHFGPPDHLHTDNGLEFSSDEWCSLLEALQVQHSFSVAYHPQSNEVVERTNRTVKDALAALAVAHSSACCAPRPELGHPPDRG